MGRFCLFVRPLVRSYVPPLWAIQPGLRPSQPGLRPSQTGLRPSQPGLRPSQPGLADGLGGGTDGQMDGRTDRRTNGLMENLPILQDFVPYLGRCPASPHENLGERTREPLTIRCLWTTYCFLSKRISAYYSASGTRSHLTERRREIRWRCPSWQKEAK